MPRPLHHERLTPKDETARDDPPRSDRPLRILQAVHRAGRDLERMRSGLSLGGRRRQYQAHQSAHEQRSEASNVMRHDKFLAGHEQWTGSCARLPALPAASRQGMRQPTIYRLVRARSCPATDDGHEVIEAAAFRRTSTASPSPWCDHDGAMQVVARRPRRAAPDGLGDSDCGMTISTVSGLIGYACN